MAFTLQYSAWLVATFFVATSPLSHKVSDVLYPLHGMYKMDANDDVKLVLPHICLGRHGLPRSM